LEASPIKRLFDLKLPAFELKLPKVKRMNMDVCAHNTTIQTRVKKYANPYNERSALGSSSYCAGDDVAKRSNYL
jgi:hypothetical protein